MSRRRRIVIAIAFLLIVAPAVPTSVRSLAQRARAAHDLRALPPDVRERAIFGWPVVIAREVAGAHSVDLVMTSASERDLAVFTGALLAPREIRYFAGMDAWRLRQRAIFFHDSSSANAPNPLPPGRAAVTVVLDQRREPPYSILRADSL
ncbi:MAG TPA: hypothetical protein VEK79_10650 [Thermoanaerobaculia bacterium]|nr:hypothetical protein [Thermoanaerobaculia bacterium]